MLLMAKNRRKAQKQMVFVDDLQSFARLLAKRVYPGDRICLTGDLGSGKTTLAHAFLREWGLPDHAPFSSPTFTILNTYPFTDKTIHHMDLYRLKTFAEMENLDLLAPFEDPGTITLVEWGNKFTELLPYYGKRIHFEYVRGKSLDRMVEFEGF